MMISPLLDKRPICSSIPSRERRSIPVAFTLVVIFFTLVACQQFTPSGPKSFAGKVEQTSYLLLEWPEGLRILIWDDIFDGGHQNHGESATNDPIFHQSGNAESADGRRYEYSLETRDGLQAEFAIDGNPYDLGRGKLFLIRTAGSRTQVEQLNLDLSAISPTNQGIEAFGRQSPEVAAFILEQAANPRWEASMTSDDKCPDAFRVSETPPVTAPPSESVSQSIKGYVVQSSCREGEWYFTLEMGLNAVRPCDESGASSTRGAPGYTVKGVEGLLTLLQQISVTEHISWCGYEGRQRLPDPSLTAAAVTKDGSLWYAFDKFDDAGGSSPNYPRDGLYRLKNGQVSHYDIPATIRVLKIGPDGSLYLGAGCGIMNFRSEEWETLLDLDCSRRTSVSSLFPIDMDFADGGLLWVGGAYSLASYDGQTWTEYDIPAVRVVVAPDGSIWTKGWDGRADSDCCLTHLSGGQWLTYTWSADLPAEPKVIDSLLEKSE